MTLLTYLRRKRELTCIFEMPIIKQIRVFLKMNSKQKWRDKSPTVGPYLNILPPLYLRSSGESEWTTWRTTVSDVLELITAQKQHLLNSQSSPQSFRQRTGSCISSRQRMSSCIGSHARDTSDWRMSHGNKLVEVRFIRWVPVWSCCWPRLLLQSVIQGVPQLWTCLNSLNPFCFGPNGVD